MQGPGIQERRDGEAWNPGEVRCRGLESRRGEMERVLIMSGNVKSKVLLFLIFSHGREEVQAEFSRTSLFVSSGDQLSISSEQSESHPVLGLEIVEMFLGFEVSVKLESSFRRLQDIPEDIIKGEGCCHKADS